MATGIPIFLSWPNCNISLCVFSPIPSFEAVHQQNCKRLVGRWLLSLSMTFSSLLSWLAILRSVVQIIIFTAKPYCLVYSVCFGHLLSIIHKGENFILVCYIPRDHGNFNRLYKIIYELRAVAKNKTS